MIVEPVVGNMGCVPPLPGYLEALREITARYGALLIFDEVMTGFRVAFGGAQQRYGIRPDLTTLGKVIGGGLPVGAYGGRKDIMSKVAPAGPVYQAGTLSGNPLAVAAGLAMLRHLKAHPEIYDHLEARAARLGAAAPAGITVNRVGSMFTFFFTDRPVTDYDSAKRSDTARFGRFFRAMLERGVYLAPSQFEAAFVSAAHTEEDIERTIAASTRSVRGQRLIERSRRRAENVTIPKKTAKLIPITVSLRPVESSRAPGSGGRREIERDPEVQAGGGVREIVHHQNVVSGCRDIGVHLSAPPGRGFGDDPVRKTVAQVFEIVAAHQRETDVAMPAGSIETRRYQRGILFQTEFDVTPFARRNLVDVVDQIDSRGNG